MQCAVHMALTQSSLSQLARTSSRTRLDSTAAIDCTDAGMDGTVHGSTLGLPSRNGQCNWRGRLLPVCVYLLFTREAW